MSTEKSKQALANLLTKASDWGTNESYIPQQTASIEDGNIFLIDKTLNEFKNELETAQEAELLGAKDADFLLEIFEKVENEELSRFDEILEMSKDPDVINRLQYGGFILSLELLGLDGEIEQKFGSKNYILNSRPGDLADKESELLKMVKTFTEQGFLIKHTFLFSDGSLKRTDSPTIKKLDREVLSEKYPWFRKLIPKHHLFDV